MKTTRGSFDDSEQTGHPASAGDELDALLAHAPRYTPPADFAERVIAALHEDEKASRALPRPWYLRPYSWGSAVAACLTATLCLFSLSEPTATTDALAMDDALLVEEVLDSIDDPDLVSAICCVSTGAYSISTGDASAY